MLARDSIPDYGDCKTSDDFKKLKLDGRITNLDEKGIEKLTDPTQAKIIRMKNLKTDVKDDDDKSIDYFAQVIAGDDSVYDDSKNFIKPPPPSLKEPSADKKPASMDEARFKELYNKDMYSVIQLLHETEKNITAAKEAEEYAIKAAKEQRMKLDSERKKTKREKDLRLKAEAELNKAKGLIENTKSPHEKESRTHQ